VFRFIDAEKDNHPIALMCRVLGVSRSGYYAWRGRPPSPRAQRDTRLLAEITAIYNDSRNTYGAPRVHVELIACGREFCGRKKVARIMHDAGLVGRCGRRPAPKTTTRTPAEPAVPDLVMRRFTAERPNAIWTADLTYIPTWEGWLYLAVLLDLFSRAIVGWAMAEHMRTELVVEALKMAWTRRLPPAGLIHHSDRGSQYLSAAYQAQLQAFGMRPSAGRVGQCWDNAVTESFLATFKIECIHRRAWPTRALARTATYEYIEVFYNRRRIHSALDYHSPLEYEALWLPNAKAA
jgi:putative transposase